MKIPNAKKVPHSYSKFNDEIVDEYHWMRDLKDDPDVKKHLEIENEYAKAFLNKSKDIQDEIFNELKDRVPKTYSTYGHVYGEYKYFEKYEEDKEYTIHCRTHLSTQKEEVILDENEEASKYKYYDMSLFDVSPNNKYAAVFVDTKGDEKYTLKFFDMEKKVYLSDQIEGLSPTSAWLSTSDYIYYIELNDNLRPYQVKIHKIGDDITNDRIIYTESSGEMFVSISETKDHEYIVIRSSGSITTESLYFKGDDFSPTPQVIYPRQKGIEYYVDHKGGNFYFIINDTHKNFRITKAPVSKPQDISEVIAPHDDVYINDFDCFKDFYILSSKKEGLDRIFILDENFKQYQIPIEVEAYEIWSGENAMFDTSEFLYGTSTPISPDAIYKLDINTKKSQKVWQKDYKGINSDDYFVKRIRAKSHDGALVPMTIVGKKDTKRDGSAHALLYGYGAYGSAIPPYFNHKIFSLLDRGVIFAMGHVRGSSTLGRHWYEDGKFLKKKNSFLDFIACAKSLIDNNYTSKGKIFIQGGSAGGMLVGSTLNLDKDQLFKGAIAQVPFVDVLNTMLDSSLPLTELEYDEWGNPNDKEYFEYIKSYSPYDNIEEREYPYIYVTAGISDPRVTYWEPMKWVARLRDKATHSERFFLDTNMDSGHFGSTGRFEYLKEDAKVYSFILQVSTYDTY